MRNTSARVLLGAGAFTLSLAGLTVAVAQPALLKAPVVNSTSTEASGPALKLDASTGEQVPGTFRQFRAVGTKTQDGKPLGGGDVAVYDSYSETTFTPQGGTEVPLTKTLYTQAFDRSTGAGRPSVAGDTAGTTANVFKLPFGTEKKTYAMWDSTAKKAFPLTYVGEKTLQGLPVYEFKQVVTPTNLGPLPVVKAVPGALVGEPGTPSIPADQWVEDLDKRILVEPTTGSIVGGVSAPHIWAQTADGRKVDVLTIRAAVPTAAAQKALVASAKESKSKAQLLQRAPFVLAALGLLLLGLGAALLRRRRTTADAATSEPAGVSLGKRERPDVSGVLPTPRHEARTEVADRR